MTRVRLLSAVLLLLGCVSVAEARDRSKEWEQVRDADRKQLPRTAIELLTKIEREARRENATAEGEPASSSSATRSITASVRRRPASMRTRSSLVATATVSPLAATARGRCWSASSSICASTWPLAAFTTSTAPGWATAMRSASRYTTARGAR